MPQCCVRGCKSGYKSNPEKHHYFKNNDPKIKPLWDAAVGKTLGKSDYVCDRHFDLSEMSASKSLKDNCGTTLGFSPYVIWRVNRDAVPSKNLSPIAPPDVGTNDALASADVEDVVEVEENADRSQLTFQDLFDAKELSLPLFWQKFKIHDEKGEERICFSKHVSKTVNGTECTVVHQEVVVNKELQFTTNAMGKRINAASIGLKGTTVTDIDHMNDILQLVSSHNVCNGVETTDDTTTSVSYRDPANVLRHKECDLLLARKTKCDKCYNVKRSLEAKKKRFEDNGGISKRLRFNSSLPAEEQKKITLMKKKLDSTKTANSKLQQRILDLKSELQKSHQDLATQDAAAVEGLMEKLNIHKHQREAVRHILSVAKNKDPRQNRYSENWILLCILMHLRSPAEYRLIHENKILPVPDVRTIRRYLSSIDFKCGFDPKFFEVLAASFQEKTEIQKHGVLLVDEISTRKNITVKSRTLTYSGLVDFGDSDVAKSCHSRADHGLVILFQPLFDVYAQPVAVFASEGPVGGTVLAQLLTKATILLEKVGANVHGIVSDGASNNRKFWSEFGVSGELGQVKCYLQHPSDETRKMFVFSDMPHLLKTIRNRLYSSGELKMSEEDGIIKWSHFETLLDEELKIGDRAVRLTPKLTLNHVKLNSSSKMRVRLAAQLFSNRVSSALLLYKRFVPQLKDSDGTSKFCKWINDLFDAMNSNSSSAGLSTDSADFKVLKEAVVKLDEWEQRVNKKEIPASMYLTKQTAQGLRVTLHSAIGITEYLKSKYNIDRVYTKQLNQDALERFFGTVRLAGGSNDHPSTPTFLQLYKLLSIYSVIKPPMAGNCTVLSEDRQGALISSSFLKMAFHKDTKKSCIEEIKDKLNSCVQHADWSLEDVVDIDHDYCAPQVTDCAIYYTTSVLISKVKDSVKCDTCTDALVQHKWHVPEGGILEINPQLVHPNRNFYNFVRYLEATYQKHLKSADVLHCMLDDILADNILAFPCVVHKNDVVPFLIYHYVHMRMQQQCQQIKAESLKTSQKQRKIAKFYAE